MKMLQRDHFCICVNIIEASNLPNPNISSLVCIKVGDDKRYTNVVKHTDRPYYNEYFVFDMKTTFVSLMNIVVELSIFQPRKAYRLKKLVGCISLDVATVWAQKDRRLKAWLVVTLPSDVTARERGLLNCDINVEADSFFKQLPQLAPIETPMVLGGLRARYMVKIYHFTGLEIQETDKGRPDVFVEVNFAGKSGHSTKRLLRESVEWNEQITFVEMFPPLHQKMILNIYVGKNMFVSKDFYLSDISNLSSEGFLPTFGPTYLHLYTSENVYFASLLMAIDTEVITLLKNTEILSKVTMKSIQQTTQTEYGAMERFLCYGVVFDVVLSDIMLSHSDINISISLGNAGRYPIVDGENNTTTGKYKALLGGSDFVYLPLNEQKPCVFISFEWPNTRHRLYNSNMISRLCNILSARIDFVHDLISRDNREEAKTILLAGLRIIQIECSKTPRNLLKGVTKLDSERLRLVSKQLIRLSKTVIDGDSVEKLLKTSQIFLSILIILRDDIQDSLPKLLVSLKNGQKLIGYCEVHPKEIIFSKTDSKKGIYSGKITSLFLKTRERYNIGRLDLWLWLGGWNQVSLCLQVLPDGHEDIMKATSLPLTLTYTTNEIFSAVCHIFGGYITGGIGKEGICDSVIKIFISKQCRKTRTIKRSLTPLWKETLIFNDLHFHYSLNQIEKYPPSVTIELWDQSTKRPTLMGTNLIIPTVRLQPLPTITEYNLQWTQLGEYSQILTHFEIIQTAEGSDYGEISKTDKTPSILPQFIEFPTISYRLEVVFWGIRSEDFRNFKYIGQLQAIIQCCSNEIKSDVIVRANRYANFIHDLRIIDLELPEITIYSPPLVVHVTSNKFVGFDIEKNIHRYLNELPTRKQRKALNTNHKSVIERAKARHSTFRMAMPDLIPLIDIDADNTSSNAENNCFAFLRECMCFSTTFKDFINNIKGFCYAIERNAPLTVLQDENDEEYDWWHKYFSTSFKIYESELESQQEFNGFNDVFKSFLTKQQESDNIVNILKLKVLMCLYRWPVVEPVVTLQGQDPALGVLEYTDLSERVKVFVRVYCIKAHNLHPYDLNGKADPYIEIFTPSKHVSDKSNYISKQLNPVFGRCLEITATFPIDSFLTVRVMDWDRFTAHDLIGETVIDLENRFYSKHRASCGLASAYSETGYNTWRDLEKPTDILEKLCNTYNLPLPQYYDKSVLIASKEFVIRHKARDIEETKQRLALMALNHWHEVPLVGVYLVPEHIETRILLNKNRPGIVQGKLEMWVDMFDLSMGEVPPPVDISPRKPQSYELRVIIWNTAKVPLVDDSYFVGKKHTDIFVKGWLWDPKSAQSTDVHYTSINGEGNFNWRFIFPFLYLRTEKRMVVYKKNFFDVQKAEYKVPALLHLQVWDSDRLSANDFIGAMVMELCSMPRGARSVRTCKVQKTNTVDLFKVKRMRGWWPFLQENKTSKRNYGGFLEAEFILLTADEAMISPAGLGRSEPAALSPPLRPEFQTRFWLAPLRIILHLVCGVHRGKMILCLLIFGAVLFALVGVYSIPMFIIKRIIGA